MLNYSNELRRLSEENGSRSHCICELPEAKLWMCLLVSNGSTQHPSQHKDWIFYPLCYLDPGACNTRHVRSQVFEVSLWLGRKQLILQIWQQILSPWICLSSFHPVDPAFFLSNRFSWVISAILSTITVSRITAQPSWNQYLPFYPSARICRSTHWWALPSSNSILQRSDICMVPLSPSSTIFSFSSGVYDLLCSTMLRA